MYRIESYRSCSCR